MKTVKLHWVFLFCYFVFSSIFLLSTSTAHHSDSALPYVLILLPLLLLVWNPAKSSNLALLSLVVAIFFVAIHVSPFVPIAQSHHQSDASNPHPCCMPQTATVTFGLDLIQRIAFVSETKEKSVLSVSIPSTNIITTRAPPHIS